MKKIIALIVLFQTCFVFAQEKIITYSIKLSKEKEFENLEYLKKMQEKAIQSTKNITYTLTISDSITRFTLDENMEMDANQNGRAFAMTLIEVDKDIYVKNNFSYRNNGATFFDENEYIIEEKIDTNWVLSTETKLIDKKTCYKATTTYYGRNSDKIFQYPITAWYCPEIPLSYGPAGFGGLPGLILELQKNKVTFGATKINLNSKKKTLTTMPLKGKLISKEDYENKVIIIAKSIQEENAKRKEESKKTLKN
jgi:GLPGLI family protein